MNRTVLAVLGGALLGVAACGPLDDGGGGDLGAPCQSELDCVSNGCCGDGTTAVAVGQQPVCPGSCTNGRTPHSPCVNGGSGIVACLTNHCGVAQGLPGSCNFFVEQEVPTR
jgi:hypothetical protein